MNHRVTVVQILRVEKSLTLLVEADTLATAREAVSSGEIDLPSASDDAGKVWTVDRCSLEHEEGLRG